MNQKWNAENYSSGFSFVYKYGNDVLNLIEGENVHDVIDLGCGTGVLTNALSERGYNVTGIDASDEMLEKARASFPAVNFVKGDAVNFVVDAPVDVVFSNAVLHWIDKKLQPEMMRRVYGALRPGGQFVFEMAGYGCGKAIHDELAVNFRVLGYDYVMPFFLPKIGEYAAMLEACGFTARYAILFDRPTELKGDDGLRDWIRMFIKRPFSGVKDDDRDEILRRTNENLRGKLFHGGKWYADYVRLRMRAIKQ
ncbi:MAG: methyltransferase domain-containing protein [Synergistaceae bacterium]|nr:methyltransferase domain-containing protein [Synergistaceae bacterium]